MKALVLVAACGLASACATPEWQAANNQCDIRYNREIPANYQQVTVERNRRVEVPDGSYTCTTKTKGNTQKTHCEPEYRVEYQPYLALETVDLNKSRRDAEIAHCTASLCLERYGNIDCQPPLPQALPAPAGMATAPESL